MGSHQGNNAKRHHFRLSRACCPASSEGVEFRALFLRPFAPCLAFTSKGPRVYLRASRRLL